MANILAATTHLEESSLGQVYNVASGSNISVLEVARLIASDLVFLEKRPAEAEATLGIIDKITGTMGWRPQDRYSRVDIRREEEDRLW